MKAQNKLCDRDVRLLAAGKRIEDLSRRQQGLNVWMWVAQMRPARSCQRGEIACRTWPDISLPELRHRLAVGCPRLNAVSVYDLCGVGTGCPEFIFVGEQVKKAE